MWAWVELIPEAVQMHPLICCLQAHAFLWVACNGTQQLLQLSEEGPTNLYNGYHATGLT